MKQHNKQTDKSPEKEIDNLWDNGCGMMESVGSPLCDGKNYLCDECRMKVSYFRFGKQEGIKQGRILEHKEMQEIVCQEEKAIRKAEQERIINWLLKRAEEGLVNGSISVDELISKIKENK